MIRSLAVGSLMIALAWVGASAAGACSEAPNAYVFAGEATEVARGAVTYRVDGVVSVNPDIPADVPEPGAEVLIAYGDDDATFVHVGERYQVGTVIEAGRRVSWTRPESGCGSARTMHADGSPIDTGLFGPDGFRSWPGTTPIVVAVGLVVVVVVALVVGRRRRRSTVAAHGS